jgi:uncharacterized protein YutD
MNNIACLSCTTIVQPTSWAKKSQTVNIYLSDKTSNAFQVRKVYKQQFSSAFLDRKIDDVTDHHDVVVGAQEFMQLAYRYEHEDGKLSNRQPNK